MRSRFMRHPFSATVLIVGIFLMSGGLAWFLLRYDASPRQVVSLRSFSDEEYPDNPERRSRAYGAYPHRALLIEQVDGTRFRFVLEPGSDRATQIELRDVDLALVVATVPRWVLPDADLTKVGVIDREWNRQQIRFARASPHVQVREGGDGFEQRTLSRVDLARNCLNAGLWELMLFTTEDGEERLYGHLWFTFPLGLYKDLFEEVNGLSYWSFWWSLEHWVDPSGTRIRLDRMRTVEQERPVSARVQWDEPVAVEGEQVLKYRNILTVPAATYRDWYGRPVRFASFIQPGLYSRTHPRETQLHYLAEFTGAIARQITVAGGRPGLLELELGFLSHKTGEATRLILGGLDVSALPALSPQQYDQGWKVPLGIGNPGFFESYETLAANPPMQRTFYGFHLDAQDRWLDHHAIGVDGPLLHRDVADPSLLHLYLLSYERHTLLNHLIFALPAEPHRALSPASDKGGPAPVIRPCASEKLISLLCRYAQRLTI